MTRRTQKFSLLVIGALCAGVVFAAVGIASPPSTPMLTEVLTANPRSDGYSPASKLSAELKQVVVAQGSTRLENTSPLTSYYGYDNDVLNAAGAPQMLPTPTSPSTEAKKTEPDKNTYLTFKQGLEGADPGYDYGTHFLFQGHEGGAGGAGYITRINLDADARTPGHPARDAATSKATRSPRSTARPGTRGRSGCCSPPRTRPPRSTPRRRTYPSTVVDVSGALGRGGYEGIQDDSDGNIWIVEDVGGVDQAGARRRSGPTASSTATCPPNPATSRTASCRCCRC